MLKLLNTPFCKTLLLSRGVILGIFFQVAVLTRLGNRLRNLGGGPPSSAALAPPEGLAPPALSWVRDSYGNALM